MHNNLTKWGCQEATIINRLMGKGNNFKRKAEKLIELCKSIKAQNYCRNKAVLSPTSFLVIKHSFGKEN